MNRESLVGVLKQISDSMTANCDMLVELDQKNGDGDLGISMSNGFGAAYAAVEKSEECDLGKLLRKCSIELNENSPSTLGTVISIGIMGMAKELKGCTESDLVHLSIAFDRGLEDIMARANSKPGEKTILDAFCPAVQALKSMIGTNDWVAALHAAAEAAACGSENTRKMRAVHGRAAYYGDNSIGMIDGGSVAGKLIFEAMADYAAGDKPVK